jgi:hypothetical protein
MKLLSVLISEQFVHGFIRVNVAHAICYQLRKIPRCPL